MNERVSDGKVIPDDQPLMIDTMSAYVAFDTEDNTEGIIAVEIDGTWMPMVGADAEMMQSLRPAAEEIARDSGRKISLVRFSTREVLVDDILQDVE